MECHRIKTSAYKNSDGQRNIICSAIHFFLPWAQKRSGWLEPLKRWTASLFFFTFSDTLFNWLISLNTFAFVEFPLDGRMTVVAHPPSLHSHPSCLSEERSSKLKEYCTWLESWAHARDILETGWCQRWFWYATDVGRLLTVQWGYIAGRRGDYMILRWRCWFCDFKEHSAAV